MATYNTIANGLRLAGTVGCTNDIVNSWLKGLGVTGTTPDMLFAYLRSTGLTGTLSDMLSAYVFSSGTVLIDLSPTSNGHYTLGTDSVLTTAYKLGISTILPTASTTYALYGRASSATDYLKILSSGYLSLDVDGTVVTSTTLATKDSKFREYSVTLEGNDFIFKEKDAVISTVTNATAAAKTLTLNLIANSNGASFYQGTLADAVIGSIKFGLNELTANTETNNGVTLTYQNIGTGIDVRDTYTLIAADYDGSELISGVAPNSIASGWTDNGDGSFTADGTQANTVPIQWFTAGTTVGTQYYTVFNVTVTNGIDAWVRIGDDESGRRTSVGEYITTLKSTGGNANVNIRCLSNFAGTVSLAVKRKIEVA